MSQILCENQTCRGTAVPSGNVRICQKCQDRLVGLLVELPVLHARCGELLHGERTLGVARAWGGRLQGIVLRDDLVDLRSELLSLTASWAALILDEARPARRPRRDLRGLVNFLLIQRHWLAAHAAIGDALEEFTEVSARAERAIDPGPRRVELGTCSRPGCAETVYAHLSASSCGKGLVSCRAGHTLQPHQWLALDRRRDGRQSAVRHGEQVA